MRLGVGETGDGIELRLAASDTPRLEPSSEADQTSPRRNYVYAHFDEAGAPFYIGKGVGSRAWNGSRRSLWHRYVEHHLKGRYVVRILRDNLTPEQAEELESRWIAQEGDRLVNWINFSRKTVFEALSRYHALRDANRQLIAATRAKEKADPEAAVAAYKRAIENAAAYAKLRTEEGLIGQLIEEERQELGYSGELEALDRLTLCLVRLGRGADALAASDKYFTDYRIDSARSLADSIKRRVCKAARQ